MSKHARLVCVELVTLSYLLWGCTPTAAERERRAKLAKVRRIALVAFVGKSSVSPDAPTLKRFTNDAFAAFRQAAGGSAPIEFIPIQDIVANDAYRRVAKIRMPAGAYSPIDGLTYVRQGTEGGSDHTSLLRSLNADALLEIVVDYGAAVRQNGSTFHLVAKVLAHLVGTPEAVLWEGPTHFESPIPANMWSHPKLVGTLGAKWVVMAGPDASEHAQLMAIAAEGKTNLPERIGASIVEDILAAIKKAGQQ